MKDAGMRNPASRRRIALACTLALAIASCALFDGSEPEPLAFSHRQHVSELAIDCSVCHKTEPEMALPTLPRPEVCLLCHKDLDAEKPQDRRIHVLFENDVYLAAHASRLEREIRFDHAAHVDRGESCASCHEAIGNDERITAEDAVPMERCVACHDRYRPNEACSACHTQIDADWQPPSHYHEWLKAHGPLMRAGTTLESGRCSLCHGESTCVQCHQERRPENHDEFWRLRGHAIPASIDRQNCWACHREDYCQRCHMEVLPMSHTGNFGAPRDTHCLGCHFPLAGEGCGSCHTSTPSHSLAPPKPPDHNPAMNCRMCHGVGAPLMHVDNGSDCNSCHP